MADEPGGWELQRSVDGLRQDVRNGNGAINARLDRLVSAEVHASDLRRVDELLAGLTSDVADERAARLSDIAAEREARKTAVADVQAQMQRMVTTQRWVAAAIALPIALFIGNLLLIRSGGG